LKTLNLFFLVASTVVGAARADVTWLKLGPTMVYKDINTYCGSDFMKDLYFGVETAANGAVVKASIRDSLDGLLVEQIAFNTDELPGIELVRDKVGRGWLKTLPLSGRVIVWLLHHSGGDCRPMHRLATMASIPYSFVFNIEGLGENVLHSMTPRAKLKGQRSDGASYEAELELMQSQASTKR